MRMELTILGSHKYVHLGN